MGEKIKVIQYKMVELTPEMVAEAFTQMDNIEQAEFFECMAELWGKLDFDNKMSYVGDTLGLSDGAREIMRIIGSHSQG